MLFHGYASKKSDFIPFISPFKRVVGVFADIVENKFCKIDFLVYFLKCFRKTMTKAENTKQLILEKAAVIYNSKGINGTAIDDVLDAAKVTKGCLYSHFENKEDLSVQTADYLLYKIGYGIGQAMMKEKTAKAKIFAYLDFNKSPLSTYIEGGCPIFNMAVEADDNHAPIKKKVSKMVNMSQESFVDILNRGIENGEFSKDLDPVVFAFKVFSAVEGGIIMCRVMNDNAPMGGLIKSLKEDLERYEVK